MKRPGVVKGLPLNIFLRDACDSGFGTRLSRNLAPCETSKFRN